MLAAMLLLADRGSSRPPEPATNVRMNAPQLPSPDGLLGRAAEAIAADAEGRYLVAAWETTRGFCGPPAGQACKPPAAPGITGFGYSTDHGRTWLDGGAPLRVGETVTAGHPWLDRGGADNRTFFLASRAWNLSEPGPRNIMFYRGEFRDGAFAWRDGRVLAPPHPGDAWRGPSLAAAKDGSGNVFLSVINLRDVCGVPGGGVGQIEVVKSLDGGGTWEKPVVVAPDDSSGLEDAKSPSCGNTGTIQLAPSMALGPRGEVYVVWLFGPALTEISRSGRSALFHQEVNVHFARSLDGGRTFSSPRDLAAIHSIRLEPPVGYSGDTINDFPRIAAAADGPHQGRIYVTFDSAPAAATSAPDGQCLVSSQVFLVFSDDQGRTWRRPVPLGPPVPPAGVKRLWPSVFVKPGGRVGVVYAESQERRVTAGSGSFECKVPLISGRSRSSKVSSLVDFYLALSSDGGATFRPPVRLTTETSNWCATHYDSLVGGLFANFGDYLGIFATERSTFLAWTDGRSGVPDAYYADIEGSTRLAVKP